MKIFRLLILSLLGFSLIFFWSGYGFRINLTDSLPHSLYFSKPKQALVIEKIVTFSLPTSSVTFAKQIAALPGDFIEIKNRIVFINGSEKCRVLESFEPIHDGIIPEGYCFVLGLHPESFDSRYADFGLVPLNAIKESLCHIF